MSVKLPASASYHLHVALQFADARSLALGGAHVAQVMDGDGRTDAGFHLSHCGAGNVDTQGFIHVWFFLKI